ncbi:dihydroxyacetone kinase subunit L [Saccharopolyspora erythraea]|uniref:dihydroxyacetone kinase subunit DhaL n=1 Tax=Saccharopolyspora erythraea TaxID=1836 RepID=UPI001BA602B7|nr:dihydroxyacetone kinase subunit DhaL [Saccharopolyspora erythraea]QUH04362.1 dihydroxyacetone kinase subunit L [Saccharopolyspora erythraea]
MQSLTAEDARSWIDRFTADIDDRFADLTDLDRRAGDGDYGTNLRSALRRASANLEAGPTDSPEAVFTAVANGFLNTGGTSGPLFGMWFREFAKAFAAATTAEAVATGAANAAAVVQRLGKAEVGHKTMVDAMVPAAEALSAAVGEGTDLPGALRSAATAAHEGAESTEQLLARRGRASYVGEHARGVVDPGALTVAWFFDAAVSVTAPA